MSPFKRDEGDVYYLDVRWRGLPRLKLSTGTGVKARAKAMEHMLSELRRNGRTDLLKLLAKRLLFLPELFEAYGRGELDQLRARAESPVIGPLLDTWLAWLASPSAVSAKTRRRYAPRTVHRYRMSWQRLLAVLPKGRNAGLSDIGKGFIADFRQVRCVGEDAAAPATVNRDLCALTAFLTWCAEEQGLSVTRPKIRREREPAGRERWLSSDEIRRLYTVTPAEWWPLFGTLVFTGVRVGEAQGLRGGDVRLAERRITLREGDRTLKTAGSARDVPIPEPLAVVLAEHFARYPAGPADLVFQGALGDYRTARRVFGRACTAAKLHGVTLHDLRHTFGVHCAQAGVPIARLQKLLGHATPHMTLRYMKHAPESYFAEDAAKVAASMTGAGDSEAEARVVLARGGLKRA